MDRNWTETIDVIKGKQNKVIMKQLKWIEFMEIRLWKRFLGILRLLQMF